MTAQTFRRPVVRAATLVAACIVATPVQADVVTDWNALSVGFINAGARPAPLTSLDLAMIHVAIHDAVQAYQHRFETYNAPVAGAGGSPVAAVAAAARDVLVRRFPAQTAAIETAYLGYLAGKGLSTADPGVGVGRQAALNIIVRRASDGSFPANPENFTGSTEIGQWRPTPPLFQAMTAPWLGTVTPFVQRDVDGLLHEPPPPGLTSGIYARDYNEVKTFGRAGTGSARTVEQTTIAFFYSGNTMVLTQLALRTVALANLSDIGDTARLFALANMAAADALINAWSNKRTFNVWRPSTAIVNGDADGNHATEGEPAWSPLFADPPYPDYTSGANSFVGSIMRVLERVLGEEVAPFGLTTTARQNGAEMAPRVYTRFADVAEDVVDARVYMGIHFRFADVVARRQARQSADQVVAHGLRPLN
jgi:hypothetical protein